MTVQVLYSILSNIDVIVVKDDTTIFTGMADNIPIVLMNEWVECIKIDYEDLVIILK